MVGLDGWPPRLRDGAQAILKLARTRTIRLSTIGAVLAEIAEISRVALDVGRASVWRLHDGALEGKVQAEGVRAGPFTHRLPLDRCSAYLARLREELAIALSDVRGDPICAGLEGYLEEFGVGALLDIPLAHGGTLLGVICHEHVGGPRSWSNDEVLFANLVAGVVLAQLEAEERLRAEFRAEGTEARYAHLVESLPVTVYAFDIRSGKLEYLSPNSTQLGGLDPEAFFSWGGVEAWLAAIDPADRPPILARFQETLSESFDPDVTYRITLPDGRRAFVRDRCSVVRDPLGRPVALHGMLADVTVEHEAQLETLEYARRFRELLGNSELGAVMFDLSGRITFVNVTFCALMGTTAEQLLGASWFDDVVAPADRTSCREHLLSRLDRGEVPGRTECLVRTTKGEVRRMLWTNIALRRPDGAAGGVASLGIDLTERDRLEVQRHHAQRLESLGQLAAGVAHDFNNLLQVLFVTNDELGQLSPEVAALAKEQAMVLSQGKALVDSLLGYARGPSPGVPGCGVDDQLNAALPILSRVAGARSLIVELQAAGVRIGVDPQQLQQVLVNLVTNAAQAMEGRDGAIRISTTRVVSDEGPLVRIRVTDQGIGIKPELLERIFEPFFTSKADRGTGLGLATVQAIVRRTRGVIEVESLPGHGATFELRWPEELSSPAPSQ